VTQRLRPVLFLDFKEALWSDSPYDAYDVTDALYGKHVNAAAVYRDVFGEGGKQELKRVHDALDGELRYVISSTWRKYFERDQLAFVLTQAGLGFVAEAMEPQPRWRTSLRYFYRPRIEEFGAWLEAHHSGEPVAILAAARSDFSLLDASRSSSHPLAGRVVLCHDGVGLCDEHVEPLVRALRRPFQGIKSRHESMSAISGAEL
jgi:hypothetical protein